MKRNDYCWVVCAVATLLLFVTMGTVSNGFSVFLPYIMDHQGFTHAQTSSLITLRCLVSFFAMLGIGIYYRKVSLRIGTAIAAACAGVILQVFAGVTSASAEGAVLMRFSWDGSIGWRGLILAAALLVLTRWVKPTKDLHPIVFIGLSAAAGVVFRFAGA